MSRTLGWMDQYLEDAIDKVITDNKVWITVIQKTHTLFKNQNGQNRYPISDQNG